MRRAWIGMAVALSLLAACGGGETDGESAATVTTRASTTTTAPTTTTTTAPTTTTTAPPAAPPPVAQLESVRITATPIVDTEMLTDIAWRKGDPDPYICDQHGQVFHVVDGVAEPVLDLRPNVLDYREAAEYGLLGMAFDPAGGRLFVGYNGNDVHTRIESYAVGADGRPDPASVREVLQIEQPGLGHNSGTLAFDPDGNLMIAMGDGGGSSGADAQDMTKLLGGILRITPNPDGPGYTVPDDNPYVDQPGVAPEIWGKGMRQPWRFSIDTPTGDVWVGVVGNEDWEAVYRIPGGTSGVNFGWPTFEGSHEINYNPSVTAPPDPMMPVYEYSHDVGPAVIGGYVYRGTALPGLAGSYVFMDMTGPVWALGSDGIARLDLDVGGVQTSFGQDPDGELYLLTQYNGLFKLQPA